MAPPRRVRPIDTTRALPGTALRDWLEHLDQVLTDSAADLVRAPAARDMLHATLRHWARTVDARDVELAERAYGREQLARRLHLPLPPTSTPGVPDGDLARMLAVRHLREHGWLIAHLPIPRNTPARYRAATGTPFGATGAAAS